MVSDADLRRRNLHYFAMALTIGICFGIYSSVLVAGPIHAENLATDRRDPEGVETGRVRWPDRLRRWARSANREMPASRVTGFGPDFPDQPRLLAMDSKADRACWPRSSRRPTGTIRKVDLQHHTRRWISVCLPARRFRGWRWWWRFRNPV